MSSFPASPLPSGQLPIMAHLVLGYPSLAESIRTAERYIAAGVAILELQIPFSHPTADGPVITEACRVAVEQQNVRVADCLTALRLLREKYPQQEIVVMSYLNRIYTYGLEAFGTEMTRLAIRLAIVPDLPPQAPPPVNEGKHQPVDNPLPLLPPSWGGRGELRLVPVLAANTPTARLDQLLAAGYDFYYLMSDFKITGSTFSLHPRLAKMAVRIRAARPTARIGIGFGIDTPQQVQAVLDVADYAIIGSALIRAQQEGRLEAYLESLQNHLARATPTR